MTLLGRFKLTKRIRFLLHFPQFVFRNTPHQIPKPRLLLLLGASEDKELDRQLANWKEYLQETLYGLNFFR